MEIDIDILILIFRLAAKNGCAFEITPLYPFTWYDPILRQLYAHQQSQKYLKIFYNLKEPKIRLTFKVCMRCCCWDDSSFEDSANYDKFHIVGHKFKKIRAKKIHWEMDMVGDEGLILNEFINDTSSLGYWRVCGIIMKDSEVIILVGRRQYSKLDSLSKRLEDLKYNR